jgi:hypothetical protein
MKKITREEILAYLDGLATPKEPQASLRCEAKCPNFRNLPFAVKVSCRTLGLQDNSIWSTGMFLTSGLIEVTGDENKVLQFKEWLQSLF